MKIHRRGHGERGATSYLLALALVIFVSAGIAAAADYEIQDKKSTIHIETTSFASEHHTQVVKILTEEGTSYKEFLGVNTYIQIKNLQVTVTSEGGRTNRVRSDQIYEVPVVESVDMVTDYKAIVIAPEKLKRGDVIAIDYDRAITSLLYIDPWVYATNVPIRKSTCFLIYPPTVPVKFRGEDASVKVQKSEAMGNVTVQFETIQSQEVYLSGRSESFGNVEKKVVFMPEQAMTDRWALSTRSWKDVADWFSELTRFAYREDPAMDAVVQEVKRNSKSPEEIADGLYRYIQKNYTYMAIEVGIGGYKPRFAAQTFQKKYGDCKDLTFLFLVLLKKAGIEAYPALVDTRHAKFFYRDFPSPTQFNHCIAYIPGLRKGIWVDATVKNFKLGEMPAVIQGKHALVAGGPNELIQIPEDFYSSNVLKFELTGNYSQKELIMKGFVQTLGQANAYVDLMRNALMRNAVKNYVYGKLLKPGLPVQKLQAGHAGERSLEIGFSTPVRDLEGYKMLLVNAIGYPPLENLGVDPRENEFFALGVPIRLVLNSSIDLSGHVLVSPASLHEKKGQYITYKLEWKEEDGKLRYVADVYFLNGFLNHLEMRKYKEEMQEFASLLQRTVVVR